MSAPIPYLDTLSAAVRTAGSASLGVLGITASNDSAGTLFVQLHNKASAPAVDEIPVFTYRVPATTTVTLNLAALSALRGAFPTGLAFGWSSTRDTYTEHLTDTDVSAILTLA